MNITSLGEARFASPIRHPVSDKERLPATYFKKADVPIVMRYFDLSYLIRSSPANAADSVLCDLYARNAVHAAMAGKTGLVIGFLHDSFIHIPIEMLVREKKHIDTDGVWWKAVLAASGQPARFQ
jgi:6-phosphofructokinase 1